MKDNNYIILDKLLSDLKTLVMNNPVIKKYMLSTICGISILYFIPGSTINIALMVYIGYIINRDNSNRNKIMEELIKKQDIILKKIEK